MNTLPVSCAKPLGRFEYVLWKNEPLDAEPSISLTRDGWTLNGCESHPKYIQNLESKAAFSGLFGSKIEVFAYAYDRSVLFRRIVQNGFGWWDVVRRNCDA